MGSLPSFLKGAAVGAAAVIAAIVLNPSGDAHRAKLRSAIAERSPVAGALGINALTAFASTYHSVGVASYTKVGDKLATVGLLGLVVVLD